MVRLILILSLLGAASARCATNIIPSVTTLVADGDSQTAAGTTWFFALTNAATGAGFGATGWAMFTNIAASGNSRVEIDNGYTNQARVLTNQYPGRALVYTLNGGANDDLYTTTNRWLTNVLAYSNMIARARADNFLVVHFNLLPRNGYVGGTNAIGWSNANYRINWTNFNAWAASEANPADYKMDWSSIAPASTFGDSNYWKETTPNELHLTLWANRVVATNVALLLSTNATSSDGTNFRSFSMSGGVFSGGLILR